MKPVTKLSTDQLKDQYPAVYENNKDRLEAIASKGESSIRIRHEGGWLEVSVRGYR